MESKGSKNSYICQTCRRGIVTLTVIDGTTPFMLLCEATEGCKGTMYSQMGVFNQSLPHTHEWFMPESFEGYDPETVEHFQKGGLCLRTVDGEVTRNFKPRSHKARKRRRKHNGSLQGE